MKMAGVHEAQPDPDRPSRLSILCVDDDLDILTIAKLALRLDDRISVKCASNADDALRMLIPPWYKPDCILLDVMMPHTSGQLLLGEIRMLPHHRETPVIFMTARVGEADLQSYLALGACGTIIKPFDPLRLAGQVRETLRTGVPKAEY